VPFTRFVKRGNVVDVYKRTATGEVKAFTSHSPSKRKAHETAARRELEGTTRRGRRSMR